MAIEITMPQLSDTMDQGTILSWLKKEGDSVERGDALAEVATDKADLEIESFHEGVLLKIHSPEGTTVKVGEIIAIVGEQGESVADVAPSAPAAASPEPAEPAAPATPEPAAPVAAAPVATPAPAQAATRDSNRTKISPLAKNLAQANGVNYEGLNGSGEGGRIVKKDIEEAMNGNSAVAAPAPAQAAPTQAAPALTLAPVAAPSSNQYIQSGGQTKTQPLTKMRSAIAAQMVKSMTTIPHFYVTTKLEMDSLIKMRTSIKTMPQYEGITFTHLLLKASGLALRKVPRINSVYKDETLIEQGEINIGIITALEDGLLIPVMKNADGSPLSDIVSESKALVQRARSGRPKPDDLTGGTFAISNMGRYDVESFTAIVNPSHGAILAVAGMQQEPIVRDGEVAVGNVMRVTLSVDHRIIDGLMAGEFLTELKRLIEDPVLLLA